MKADFLGKLMSVSSRQSYMGRLPHGGDLLEEITAFCRDKGIAFARVEAIGAVSHARLAFYDQSEKEYCYFEIREPMELTSLWGNISLKEGDVMVHARVNLADKEGRVWGGHLAQGTVIFACEVLIQAFNEPPLERGYDEKTGLFLWKL